MRIYCFVDKKIKEDDFRQWKVEFKDFMKDLVGMTPQFESVQWDFSTYPTYYDSDGDRRPTIKYLKSLTKHVEDLGAYAYDHIFMFVHEDNFLSSNPIPGKGIWGTNYSYTLGNIHFHYCRWDKDNPANTFGTSYHEIFHSFDALCKVEVNVDINPILGVTNFDREIVHGKHPNYSYIRYKENSDVIKTIAPHLQKAYRFRIKRRVDELKKRVTLLQRLFELRRKLRQLLNRNESVPR